MISEAELTAYQRAEVRRLRQSGWTIGRIVRVHDEWATIEISKGSYSTRAGFAATKAIERSVIGWTLADRGAS